MRPTYPVPSTLCPDCVMLSVRAPPHPSIVCGGLRPSSEGAKCGKSLGCLCSVTGAISKKARAFKACSCTVGGQANAEQQLGQTRPEHCPFAPHQSCSFVGIRCLRAAISCGGHALRPLGLRLCPLRALFLSSFVCVYLSPISCQCLTQRLCVDASRRQWEMRIATTRQMSVCLRVRMHPHVDVHGHARRGTSRRQCLTRVDSTATYGGEDKPVSGSDSVNRLSAQFAATSVSTPVSPWQSQPADPSSGKKWADPMAKAKKSVVLESN